MNQTAFRSQIKTQIFEKIGQVAATLGSPTRLKLIQLLAQSPKSVEELSQAADESIANTSQHLQRLAKEKLVFSTKNGLSRIYQVKSLHVVALWENIQNLAHELAPELNEAEDKITDASLRSPVPTDEALKRVKAGKALLVDVRDEKEAHSTPVNGALSIPLSTIKKAAPGLDRNKTIYVFCRGRHCVMATDAVKKLREEGFDAYRLRESPFSISSQQKQKGAACASHL